MTDRAEMTDSSEGNASEEAEHYAPMIEEGRTFRKLTFDAQIALQQAPGVPTKLKNERDMPYWIRTGESYESRGDVPWNCKTGQPLVSECGRGLEESQLAMEPPHAPSRTHTHRHPTDRAHRHRRRGSCSCRPRSPGCRKW